MVTWSLPAMFLRSATCRFSVLWKLPSTMEHQSRSHRCKFRRTAWYLHNFDQSLGLPDYRRQCFWCQHVPFERSLQKTTAWVRGNCRCHRPWSVSHHRLHLAISQNTHDFACWYRHSFSTIFVRCFAFCIIPTPVVRHRQQKRSKNRYRQLISLCFGQERY